MAGGGGKDDDYESDLEFWGAPDDYRPNKNPDYEIYPENWDAVQLFVRLQTQWKISPMGQRVGLEYTSIRIVARFLGIKPTPELFADIQLMEICTINECARNGNRRSQL